MANEPTDPKSGGQTDEGQDAVQSKQSYDTALASSTPEGGGQGDTKESGQDTGQASGKDDVQPKPEDKKPEGEGKQAKPEDKEGEKEPDKEGAPEQYEDFKVPEGVTIDAEEAKEFTNLARELNLPQEAAQKLVDFEVKRLGKVLEDQGKMYQEVVEGWLGEAKKDKEFGGENFDRSVEIGKRALHKFATPELIKALDQFGMGNHPEFIRFAYRVGKTVEEDETHVGRTSGEGEGKSLAERMYPSMARG